MKGMQKIRRGTGFRGVLDYGINKGTLIGGNMDAITARELASEFAIVRQLRPDIKKPVWHNSLRLPKGEIIPNKRWVKIADEYMRRMGFSDLHQRAYVLHDDEDGQHIHIIASRIALDGTLYLGKNENLISTRIIQQLEHEHNLGITKGPEIDGDGKVIFPSRSKEKKSEKELGKRRGVMSPKAKLQEIIDQIMTDNPIPTATQFAASLTAAGAKYRAHIASTGRLNGFSFELDGVSFSGSSLGKAYALLGLQKRGLSYDVERDMDSLIVHVSHVEDQPKPLFDVYRSFLAEHRTLVEAQRKDARLKRGEMVQLHQEERSASALEQRERRRCLLEKYSREPALLKIERMLLAKQQADEKAALQEKQAIERKSIFAPKLPDYAQWLASQEATFEQQKAFEAAEKRKSERKKKEGMEAEKVDAQIAGLIWINHSMNSAPADIRNFNAFVDSAHGTIEYRSANGALSFTDAGDKINVAQQRDPDAVLAAMQLGAQKFGKLAITGDAEFQRLCIGLAEEHGFKFVDENLNKAVEMERCKRMVAAAKPADLLHGMYIGKVHSVADDAVFVEERRGFLRKLPMDASLKHVQIGEMFQIKYKEGKPDVMHATQKAKDKSQGR